jgi:hypothetical protein
MRQALVSCACLATAIIRAPTKESECIRQEVIGPNREVQNPKQRFLVLEPTPFFFLTT